MLPGEATNNLGNPRPAHTESGGQLFAVQGALRVKSAYLAHGIGGEFVRGVLFAAQSGFRVSVTAIVTRPRLSALRNHIARVLSGGAQEKMIGIDAEAVIAGVAHEQPLRDRTVRQRVGDTMRSLLLCVNRGRSVAVLADAAAPQPTPVGLLDFRPETRGEWLTVMPYCCTGTRAIAAGDTIGSLVGKRAGAYRTGKQHGKLCGHDDLHRCAVPGAIAVAPRLHRVPNYTMRIG